MRHNDCGLIHVLQELAVAWRETPEAARTEIDCVVVAAIKSGPRRP